MRIYLLYLEGGSSWSLELQGDHVPAPGDRQHVGSHQYEIDSRTWGSDLQTVYVYLVPDPVFPAFSLEERGSNFRKAGWRAGEPATK